MGETCINQAPLQGVGTPRKGRGVARLAWGRHAGGGCPPSPLGLLPKEDE